MCPAWLYFQSCIFMLWQVGMIQGWPCHLALPATFSLCVCVWEKYANHTDTHMHRRLAPVNQLCMVLHTRAPDTPRFVWHHRSLCEHDTGQWLRCHRLQDGGSRAVGKYITAWPQAGNKIGTNKSSLYLFIDETRRGIRPPRSRRKTPKGTVRRRGSRSELVKPAQA